MINWMHALLHDPRRGWDPVSSEYAGKYGQQVACDEELVSQFERALDGLPGKRVVDLGSGPGQFAAEFARRGADVTCIDVSANYLSLAAARFQAAGLSATFVAGYMDQVNRLTGGGFDGAFSHVSWYYCMNDVCFAKRIVQSLRPGGVAFIRANTGAFEPIRSRRRRLVYWLNDNLLWKVGHPHPPRGRIASVFERIGDCKVEVAYSEPTADVVITRRNRG